MDVLKMSPNALEVFMIEINQTDLTTDEFIEISNWCESMFSDSSCTYRMGGDSFVFYLKKEEDAIAFKLRWT